MKSIHGGSVAPGPNVQAVVAVLAALALAASGSSSIGVSVKTAAAVTKTMTGGAVFEVPGFRTSTTGRGIIAGKPRQRCDGRRRRKAKGPQATTHRARNAPIHRRPAPLPDGETAMAGYVTWTH